MSHRRVIKTRIALIPNVSVIPDRFRSAPAFSMKILHSPKLAFVHLYRNVYEDSNAIENILDSDGDWTEAWRKDIRLILKTL